MLTKFQDVQLCCCLVSSYKQQCTWLIKLIYIISKKSYDLILS